MGWLMRWFGLDLLQAREECRQRDDDATALLNDAAYEQVRERNERHIETLARISALDTRIAVYMRRREGWDG